MDTNPTTNQAGKSRFETLFSIRYAVRVLERNARMWGVVSAAFKFASILSGTVALAAITGDKTALAVWLGVVFAGIQALDHATDPAGRRASSLAARRDYARLLAAAHRHDDAALEAAYVAVVAEDEESVIESLKKLAYNDVVREQGLDDGACFAEPWLARLVS